MVVAVVVIEKNRTQDGGTVQIHDIDGKTRHGISTSGRCSMNMGAFEAWNILR